MKPYLVIRKEDYRFTLLLATLFHILLFSALLLTLRHTPKRFLNAAAPPPIIHAVAVPRSQLPVRASDSQEEVKIRPPPKTEQAVMKPELIEKSPVALAIKEKKLTKTGIHTTPVRANKKAHSQPLAQHKPIKPVAKEKNTSPPLSVKSLQLVQKNVQQLLQQELNTSVQKHQIAARNAATTEKYRHLILQAIAQQWIVPPELNKHLETKLAVHLAPGGMVLEVVIVKSSGNPVLDRSAQTAVYKASPLPVPKKGLFNTFRQINLSVRPEGVLTQ